jgi:TrmH family RNA methyltransferase
MPNYEVVDSILQHVACLRKPERRAQEKVFVAEGFRFLYQALNDGASVKTVLYAPSVVKNGKTLGWLQGLDQQGVPCYSIEPADYYRICAANEPDGVISIVRQNWHTLPSPPLDGIYLACEEIESSGNLGSIIRTAVAAGTKALILLGNPCDPYDPVCVRATMGAIYSLRIIRCSIDELDSWSRCFDIPIIGTSPQAKLNFRDENYSPKSVIMLGGERRGMTSAAASICRKKVVIPMSSGVDSLNVSVAAGILLFEAVRGR